MSEDETEQEVAKARAIERFVRGETPDDDEGDEVDAQAMVQVAAFWQSLDAVQDDPAILALREQARARMNAVARDAVAHDAAAQPADSPAVEAARESNDNPAPSVRRWTAGPMMALAASLVLAVGVGSWTWLRQADTTPQSLAAADRILANPKGAPRSWTLADGSRLTLDTGSRVRIPAWKDERSIRIEQGTAFFQVAHDSSHPFVVSAGSNRVTAVGTAFAVRVAPDALTVTLAEGKVRVDMPDARASGTQTYLTPGQRLRLSTDDRWQVTAMDEAHDLEWRNGVLNFADAPLRTVVAEMNRYLVDPVPAPMGRDGEMRISGVFRVDDRQGFVQAMEEVKAAHARP